MTAIRLTFEVEGEAVSLRDSEGVEMRAPPPSRPEVFQNGVGVWVELAGRDGDPL
ncbi:hypothetical protein [Acuticoccus sp.]|uniref:hypothetical protein n=1 Tax=Acuticoccus sp. TaxID=1904378 RepID=UPI003B51903F